MLPVRLKMQAFASYVEAVEIDFEKLDNLFLIHGTTGSGKTAILDAIMYALYGKSSGTDRSTFRCALPAAENLPTIVEFTFRSGGNLYKFTRTIYITPKSKEQKVKQDCFIFDTATEQFRAIFENPSSTKVNEKAVEITGFDANQFRQVVILPQGKFEKFLIANSDDKEKTLSSLFSSEKYTAISTKLTEKANAMKKEIENETTALQAILATENADDISALQQKAEENEVLKNSLVPLIEEAEQKLEKSRTALTAAEVIGGKFAAMENAVQKLSELDKLSERIAFIRSALAQNTKASKLRPVYAETTATAEALTLRRNQLNAARLSVETAEKAFSAISVKSKAVAEGEQLYKEQLAKMAVLSGLADIYDKISTVESRISKISRELADAEKNCILLAEAQKKSAAETEKLTAEQNEVHEKYTVILPELLNRKKSLEAGAEAENKLIAYKKALEKIKTDAAGLKNEADKLEQKKNDAEKNYDSLYSCFMANTVAALSSSLKAGMPCPVCGSAEHPCPAQPSDNTVTSQDVTTAKQAFEQACKELSQKQSELSEKEKSITETNNKIADMVGIMEECGYSSDELNKVNGDVEIAQRKIERLPEIRQRLSQLSAQQLDLKNKSDEALQHASCLRNDASAANAEAEVLRNQLDKRYPDAVSYNAGVAKLKAEIDQFEKDKAAFDEAMKKAEKDKIEASAALSQAEEEIHIAQKNNDTANKNFSLSLSQAGFPSVEEYSKALLPDNTAAEYTAEAEHYDRERYALNERISQLENELEGKEKPELDLIRKETEDAQKDYSEKSTAFSVAKQRAEHLKKIIDDCAARFAETEKRREKYAKLAEYAKFMAGNTKISFTRYILGIILGLVVDEANSILADVHGGSFRLCIKKNPSDMRSKHGLDLEVETITSDGNAKYGVTDLSGGEKFLISLALSLGLSSVIQSRCGGIQIDAMFIDEGFGSLDTGLLREAVGILCGLTSERSTIGIISHVSELKSIIPCGISVKKGKDGSSTILSTV